MEAGARKRLLTAFRLYAVSDTDMMESYDGADDNLRYLDANEGAMRAGHKKRHHHHHRQGRKFGQPAWYLPPFHPSYHPLNPDYHP